MDSVLQRNPGPVLVVASSRTQAAVAERLLTDDGIAARICRDLESISTDDADLSRLGAVLIEEEALTGADLAELSSLAARQPAWSDLPFIVLTQGASGKRDRTRLQLPLLLGNVMFLELPFNDMTLLSAVRSALRARIRQLQVRDQIAQREADAVALADSEAKLRLALTAGRLGAWQYEIATCTLTLSAACKTQFGVKPDAPFGRVEWNAAIHPEDYPRQRRIVAHSLRRGGDFELEHRILWPDGSIHWIEVRGRTLLDARDRPAAMTGVALDVTSRRDAEAALRESEAHNRHTVELSPQIPWTATPDGRMHQVHDRWLQLTGITRNEALGGGLHLLHPDDRDGVSAAYRRAFAQGTPLDIEHRTALADGTYRWFRSHARPRRREDGSILLWYGATEDIHDRKRSEEHLLLMVNELNHRVKNTLAMVQAIAAQSFRNASSLMEAREVFTGRLMVLARAHDMLTTENWEGGYLREIVSRAINPHAIARERRFVLSGPELKIPPKMALAIAIALHELATNALKYGALASERGSVDVHWDVASQPKPRLHMVWREHGGPMVVKPTRRGFGSRLIEQGLALQLGGTVEVNYAPEGVICTVDAPLTM